VTRGRGDTEIGRWGDTGTRRHGDTEIGRWGDGGKNKKQSPRLRVTPSPRHFAPVSRPLCVSPYLPTTLSPQLLLKLSRCSFKNLPSSFREGREG